MKPSEFRTIQVTTIRFSQDVASSTARWFLEIMRTRRAMAAAVTATIVEMPTRLAVDVLHDCREAIPDGVSHYRLHRDQHRRSCTNQGPVSSSQLLTFFLEFTDHAKYLLCQKSGQQKPSPEFITQETASLLPNPLLGRYQYSRFPIPCQPHPLAFFLPFFRQQIGPVNQWRFSSRVRSPARNPALLRVPPKPKRQNVDCLIMQSIVLPG